MDKRKLFIDFDGTLVNSIKKVTELYDQDYNSQMEYAKIHWTDIYTWEFTELSLADKNTVLNYFSNCRFFINLDYMDNAKEVIYKLKDYYDIYICSIGTKSNLQFKEVWLNSNLPFVKFIGVDIDTYTDKSHIDMSNGVLIDDCKSNLDTSSAEKKICLGDIYEWNCKWNGKRCWNWYEVYDYLTN